MSCYFLYIVSKHEYLKAVLRTNGFDIAQTQPDKKG